MCESEVVVEGSQEHLKDIVKVVVNDGKVVCSGMLGKEVVIDGRIKVIDLLKHRIVLERKA